jgi:putative hydrolase of the HAD superfamily
MRRISAVTFDLWDTLIQEVPGNPSKVSDTRVNRIASVLDRTGHPHAREEIEEAYDKTGTFLQLTWDKARDMPVRDHVLFLLSCVECRLASKLAQDDFEAVVKVYADSILDYPPALLPKAKEALESVKERGYALGLISNTGKTPGSTLRVIMDNMRILQYFDVTTFSNEIMVRKPAESAFRVTLEKLGALPRAAVHIGDDPDKDIAPAKKIGMRAIQAMGPRSTRSEIADGHVVALDEVVGIIENL